MGKRPLVVVGDALLDRDIDGQASRLAPDAPVPVVDVHGVHERPGGAGLAAALAAREGREVVLVTALGDGDADQAVRGLLTDRVHMVAFARHGTVPVKTRLRAGGRPLVRLDDGGGPVGAPTPAVRRVLADAAAVLVCDYGQGTAGAVRAMLAQAARRVPVVWDPHPRGGAPVAGVRLAVPNAGEARVFAGHLAAGSGGTVLRQCAERAAALCGHWQAAAVVITLGERGALLSRGSASPMLVPARRRVAGDPCGAGDCFAATAAGALADGGLIEEAVQCAVRAATDFVAHGGAGNPTCWHPARPASSQPAPDPADPFALARSVRAAGGTVVAAGGCFDLLHVGHIGLLESARRAGDCLIVCLNGDASVTRLKGPGRPLVPATDRARVLGALGCVDAVAVFDEDVPHDLLRKLQPDIWVKGGDYTTETLPETEILRSWGGQALVLPYIADRSTTELAQRAATTAVHNE